MASSVRSAGSPSTQVESLSVWEFAFYGKSLLCMLSLRVPNVVQCSPIEKPIKRPQGWRIERSCCEAPKLDCVTLQRQNAENLKQIFPEKEYRSQSVPISTFICLWANYIFPRWVCLFCWRKYGDWSWEYILLGLPGYTQAFPNLRPGPLNCWWYTKRINHSRVAFNTRPTECPTQPWRMIDASRVYTFI